MPLPCRNSEDVHMSVTAPGYCRLIPTVFAAKSSAPVFIRSQGLVRMFAAHPCQAPHGRKAQDGSKDAVLLMRGTFG